MLMHGALHVVLPVGSGTLQASMRGLLGCLFFFQAEDGIRDSSVTGVQTCALPISELMARYGIDRALLGALHPGSDSPADRVFDLDNPWAAVKAHLLSGLAAALRCQCVDRKSVV